MSAYAIYCTDKPGSAAQRDPLKQAHLKHVEEHIDRYLIAGPLKDGNGNVIGSLIIVKAENAADARAFLESDPYYGGDFWADIAINEYYAAAGDWVGGKTW